MKKMKNTKTPLFVAGIIALFLVLWGGLTIYQRHQQKNYEMSKEDQKEELDVLNKPEGSIRLKGITYDYYDDIVNYLILGTDASGAENKKGKDYQGSMADFLLLLSIDKTARTYTWVPLDRDTITEVPLLEKDGTSYASADLQMCTAHWYGANKTASCKNTVKTVKKFFGGLPIDGYYAISMDKIPDLNHQLGGVTVTLQDDFTKYDPAMQKGATLTLNDEQAAYYLHNRLDIGDGTNLSRMSRQKQYMEGAFAKMKQKSKYNKNFAMSLFHSWKKDATTNLTGNDVSKITNLVYKSKSQGMQDIQGKTKVGKKLGDGIEHTEFYADPQSKVQVLTAMCQMKEREK